MSAPQRIAVVHCEACTGKARRRDLGILTRNHEGEEFFHAAKRLKDERGYVVGLAAGPWCPDHGELDIEAARDRARAAIDAHRRTRRVQHLAVPPKIRS